MLNSATGVPAVSVMTSRFRIPPSPSGPRSGQISLSIHPLDDRFTVEDRDGRDFADRIADMAGRAGASDRGIAFEIVRDEHPLADVVHDDLAARTVLHFITGVGIDDPEHDIRGARVENQLPSVYPTSACDRIIVLPKAIANVVSGKISRSTSRVSGSRWAPLSST